ncbi:hypothetical protein PTSG_06291 [Salpingoeca rosetta]|uniref:Uncharacterized protein n=1 Tax=Salpingoeca rosetta (strain ATCC 50818 / BSB-021) TaxID=946362 RepID=F2UCH5_SALR5|nr:uncharacterized protein PTSG_06291 [Salpingoeca rosetta]EGD74282.1 hypothetical protein PTSG_06291 [Salpingoeca rosetta]|eukprot:XP_004993182.1 hypothetical protein PTSG_06291 [Salpingoeca rosetta]
MSTTSSSPRSHSYTCTSSTSSSQRHSGEGNGGGGDGGTAGTHTRRDRSGYAELPPRAATLVVQWADRVRAKELRRQAKHQHHHFYVDGNNNDNRVLDLSSSSSSSEGGGQAPSPDAGRGSGGRSKRSGKRDKHVHFHYKPDSEAEQGRRGGRRAGGRGRDKGAGQGRYGDTRYARGMHGDVFDENAYDDDGDGFGNDNTADQGRTTDYERRFQRAPYNEARGKYGASSASTHPTAARAGSGGGRAGRGDDAGRTMMEQVDDFEDANRALRRLLSPSTAPRDPVVARERDIIFKKLDLMERANKRLQEKLQRREAEKAALENQVEHTSELQRAFEDIKTSLRESKAKADKKLKEKSRECLRLEEELARVRATQSYSSNAMRDFQQAVSDLEARAAGEKAAMKRAHKETKKRLRQCESVLQQVRQDLDVAQNNFELAVRDRDAEAQRRQQLEEKLDEGERERDSLTQQLHARGADLSALEDRLNTTTAATEETVADLNHKLDAARTQIATLKSKLATAEELAETRRNMLSEQGDIKDSALRRANEMIDNIRDQLAATQESEQKTKEELRDTTHQRDALRRDLETTQQRIESLQETSENQRKQISSLEGTTQRLELQVESLERDVSEARERATSLERDLNTARSEHLRTTGQQTEEARQQQQRLNERIAALEAELKATKDALQATEQAKLDAQRKAAAESLALREKLDYANTEKRTLKNYVAYVKSTFNSVFKDAEGEPGECD